MTTLDPQSLCYADNIHQRQSNQIASPYYKRRMFVLKEDIRGLALTHGIKNLVFITLTFSNDISLEKAKQKIANAERHFRRLFKSYIIAWDLKDRNRPHLHCIAVTQNNVRAGYDFEALEELTQIARTVSKEKRRYTKEEKKRAALLSKRATRGSALKTLQKDFSASMHRLGFGRVQIAPVKNIDSAAGYMAKALETSAGVRTRAGRNWPTGIRLLQYSNGCSRRIQGKFTKISDYARGVGKIFNAFAIPVGDWPSMMQRFGYSVPRKFTYAIEELSRRYGKVTNWHIHNVLEIAGFWLGLPMDVIAAP